MPQEFDFEINGKEVRGRSLAKHEVVGYMHWLLCKRDVADVESLRYHELSRHAQAILHTLNEHGTEEDDALMHDLEYHAARYERRERNYTVEAVALQESIDELASYLEECVPTVLV